MRSNWNGVWAASSWLCAALAAAGCGSRDGTRLAGRAHVEGGGEPPVVEAGGHVEGEQEPSETAPSSEGPPSLEPPSPADVASEADPLTQAALCAALEEERGQANLLALHRLGLEMSSVRLEGRLGTPVAGELGYVAPLEVEKVWVGPTFLEGTRTFVPVDDAERAGLSLPGRYLLGFGSPIGYSGATYPVLRDGEGWWEKEVIIPIAEREHFTDLLEYGLQGPALVGVVQISSSDQDTTTLGVAQVLAGELPSPITVHWDRTVPEVSFPRAGSGQYLATFGSIHTPEGSVTHYGQLLDLRPYDAQVRAMALRAIAAPRPERAPAPLLDAAQAYRTGWVFHRASHVLATRITGVAHECCTGAGGTFFEHGVVTDLRGGAGLERLMLGGHGYHSEEQCGDGFLLALTGVEAASPVEPASSFACGARSVWPSVYDGGLILPEVRAGLVDSEASREQVNTWLRSSEPAYLLRGMPDARAASTLGADAVWSQPLSVEDALVAAPLRWINIIGATDAGDIELETSFSSSPHESLVPQRFTLETPCSDPRLRRPGPLLAPMVVGSEVNSATSLTESNAFLIPGVLFPSYGYILRIADKYRWSVGADQVLEPAPRAPLLYE